jgi:hypothetical protein
VRNTAPRRYSGSDAGAAIHTCVLRHPVGLIGALIRGSHSFNGFAPVPTVGAPYVSDGVIRVPMPQPAPMRPNPAGLSCPSSHCWIWSTGPSAELLAALVLTVFHAGLADFPNQHTARPPRGSALIRALLQTDLHLVRPVITLSIAGGIETAHTRHQQCQQEHESWYHDSSVPLDCLLAKCRQALDSSETGKSHMIGEARNRVKACRAITTRTEGKAFNRVRTHSPRCGRAGGI